MASSELGIAVPMMARALSTGSLRLSNAGLETVPRGVFLLGDPVSPPPGQHAAGTENLPLARQAGRGARRRAEPVAAARLVPALHRQPGPHDALVSQAEAAEAASSAGDDASRWWEARPLEKLDLSDNLGLSSLADPRFAALVDLVSLRADRCSIVAVGLEAFASPALRAVSLSGNRIESLPDLSGLEALAVLDLSGNALASLPPLPCGSLEKLLVAGNRLASLGQAGAPMPRLAELDASDNRLTSIDGEAPAPASPAGGGSARSRPRRIIPPAPTSPPPLLPYPLPPPPSSPTPFVPNAAAGPFPSLRAMRLGSNAIDDDSLSAALRGATSLVELDARNNRLRSMPALPPGLDTALLGRNAIARPAVGGEAGAAAEAAAAGAAARGLDEEAAAGAAVAAVSGGAARLSVLDLSENGVASLPRLAWLALPGLVTLDLRGNSLTSLPPALGFLPSLQRLPLEGNPLRAVRRSLLGAEGGAGPLMRWLRTRAGEGEAAALARWSEAAGAADAPRRQGRGGGARGGGGDGAPRGPSSTAWAEAVAASCPRPPRGSVGVPDWPILLRDAAASAELTAPPRPRGAGPLPLPLLLFDPATVTSRLAGLRRLALVGLGFRDDAPLRTLHEACPALAELDLSSSGIVALPEGVGLLTRLTSLRCASCRITSEGADAPVVAGPGPPPRLTDLELSSNRLTVLPALLAACLRLRHVRLAGNDITLPDDDDEAALLLTPPALETLDLSSNRLTRVPAALASLPRLRLLALDNNAVRLVPPVLALAPALRDLRVAGNPQRGVRQEVIAGGGVVAYLRERVSPEEAAEWMARRPEAEARLGAVLEEEAAEREGQAAEEAERREAEEAARLGARPGDAAAAAIGGWGAAGGGRRDGGRGGGASRPGSARDGGRGGEGAARGGPAVSHARGRGTRDLRGEGPAGAGEGRGPGHRGGQGDGARAVRASTGAADGPVASGAEVAEMAALQDRLASGGISKAQQYAIKKRIAVLRAAVIRASRR